VQRALTLERQDPTLEGMREYVFRHQILHHVTYDTLLNRTRRELHGKVAAWLESITDARQGGLLGLIAKHHELAGALERAAEFYTRAAEHARERYAHVATHTYVDNALALLGNDRRRACLQLRWRLIDVRERTLNVQAKRDAQDTALDELRELAEALDDDRCRGEVSLRLAARAFQRDDMQMAEEIARKAMESASRVDDDAVRLRAQGRLSLVLACCGDIEAGRRLAQASLAGARQSGLPQVQLSLLSQLGYIASLEGDPSETRHLAEQQLEISRESGDHASELGALCGCGFSSFELGDHPSARRFLDDALRLARSLGDRSREGYALKTMSDVALAQGDDGLAAAAFATEALRIAEETQSKEYQAGALFSLGNAELVLGRLDGAARAFEQAEAIASEVDDPFRHDAAAGRARAALASGDQATAIVEAERAWAGYSADPKRLGAARPVLIQFTCWQAFELGGEPRAGEVLLAAHSFLQERAGMISDGALRQGFLRNIPEHRGIIEAWARVS
jgi:tetratricopeptide (TPR) repeat protein